MTICTKGAQLTETQKKLLELAQEIQNDTRGRNMPNYIEFQAQAVNYINKHGEGTLESVDMSRIENSSGEQVLLRFKRIPVPVPIDVLFMIELPSEIRKEIILAYDKIMTRVKSRKSTNPPSLELQRFFKELDQTQKTQNYQGIHKTHTHRLFDFIFKEMRTRANFIEKRRIRGSKLSDEEHAATKLGQFSYLLRQANRALFRIFYIKELIDEGDPEFLEKLKRDYHKGSIESIIHFLETREAGIHFEMDKVTGLMQGVLGVSDAEVIDDKYGNFILGDVDSDHLDRLREIKNGWDQLKHSALDKIKSSFDIAAEETHFLKIKESHQKGELDDQGFFAACWRQLRALEKRVSQSQDPTGWVHKSLELDCRLEKITEHDRHDALTWLYNNSASLMAFTPKLCKTMKEMIKNKKAIPSKEVKHVLDLFESNQIFLREEITREFENNLAQKTLDDFYEQHEDLRKPSGDPEKNTDLIKLHMDLFDRLMFMEEESTAHYGKLMVAFENHEEREDYLLKHLPRLREYRKLEADARKTIVLRFDAYCISDLPESHRGHLAMIMEQNVVKKIIDGDYSEIAASKLKLRFLKIKRMQEPEQEHQIRLLKRLLTIIPPAEKIRDFQASAYGAKAPQKLDLEDNQQKLESLRLELSEVDYMHHVGDADIFDLIDMSRYFHGNVSEDLTLLKNSFIDIVELKEDEPLAVSYRQLKERISEGQKVLRRGARIKVFEDAEEKLSDKGVSAQEFYEVIDRNVTELQKLMEAANEALILLKSYHHELGDKEDFAYLDEVLDPETTEAAREQYNFHEEMPYEDLQRFAALHTNRNLMLDKIIETARSNPKTLPLGLRNVFTRTILRRFDTKERKIAPDVKLKLLTELETHMDTELRYLCYLANYVEKDFLHTQAIEITLAIFNLINRDFNPLKPLKSYRGKLSANLRSKYKPRILAALLRVNTNRLLLEIEQVTKKKLDFT
jgi:hypothetical protein